MAFHVGWVSGTLEEETSGGCWCMALSWGRIFLDAVILGNNPTTS